MTRIEVKNLTKRYAAGRVPAVKDLSLQIEPGEIAALLGPSGCGKTTTLKMIAGLLAPTSGEILFDGKSVKSLPAEKRSAVMVFQEHALFPFMSVGRNVGFGLEVRGVKRKVISGKVEEMLDLVQLPEAGNRRPRDLSGGQQQRVALARALVTEPRVLLLDEPLANLDAHLRDEMRELILSIQKQTGVTTIVVTHDQEEAVLLADRIALIFDGELQHFDKPIMLFQHPHSERAARFFGGTNFIHARRRGVSIETSLGGFSLDEAQAGCMPDGESVLTIRPEHIQFVAEAGPNTLTGTVTSCIFMGTHTRCKISVGGSEIEALKSIDSCGLEEGRTINIHFPPENIWLIPRHRCSFDDEQNSR